MLMRDPNIYENAKPVPSLISDEADDERKVFFVVYYCLLIE